ncbi:MAG: TolB protein, partial [Solirubrobacteraceae bacterium]|nr:TolB protein [Solirubrobacteraceae bacterium]
MLVVLAGLAPAAPAPAAFPGSDGVIAFTSARNGDDDVYVISPDGSGLRRLTSDAAGDSAPAFSPDGSRIAFQSTRAGFADVFAMDADGSRQANLTNLGGDDVAPAFSPAGRIAYARNVGGNFDVFVMNADGSGQANLTNTPGSSELAPAFSPDGSKILFTRGFDINVMNADGTGQRDLTNSAAVENEATFSPDGGSIAFESDVDGNFEIYVMNADGTAPTRLTNDPASDVSPAFSPDGSKIAFSSDRSGDRDVWVMDEDGENPANLTRKAGVADAQPDWGALTRAAPPPPATTTPSNGASAPTSGSSTVSPPPAPPRAAPAIAPPPAPRAAAPLAQGSAPQRASAASSSGSARRRAARTPAAPAPAPALPSTGATRPLAATPPPDVVAPPANPRRSSVSSSLVRPDQLYLSRTDIERSAGIGVLLLLLLGLPARLFNQTVTANRRELAGWFAPVRDAFDAITPGAVRGLLGFAGVSAVIATGIYAFLDPQFPNKPGAAEYALGMLLAFGVLVGLQLVTWRRYVHRHLPEVAGGWSVYPGQVAVSIMCVAVSRIAHFVPGLVFGMSGGYQPRRPLSVPHAGRRALLSYSWLLAISLTAWAASIPIARAADHAGASAVVLVLDAALAVLALGGMQSVVFGLVPLMFMDGEKLYRWRRSVWLGLWSVGVLWMAIVVINPALSHHGHDEASVAWLAGLLA